MEKRRGGEEARAGARGAVMDETLTIVLLEPRKRSQNTTLNHKTLKTHGKVGHHNVTTLRHMSDDCLNMSATNVSPFSSPCRHCFQPAARTS